jgi:hypothetical protein
VTTSWEHVLAGARPGRHIAQFYTEPEFLARAVAQFVGDGLTSGNGALVIATEAHWHAIADRLARQDLEVERAQARGQLVVLDAARCLARLLVDGSPDPQRFRAVVGGAVDAVGRAGYRRVRAFGELVNLLRSDLAATLCLEELWNDLLATREVALLCSYSIDPFDPGIYRGLLQEVCARHSDLIPAEDYAGLERAVARAYTEVFGAAGEPELLRRVLLADYARPTAMPDAVAAMLAAREFVPVAIAPLLKQARRHYRAA